MPVDALAKSRLKWKCRRGLLELDLVLQDFIESEPEQGEVTALNELLELQDIDLWAIVSGRSEEFDPKFQGIVARLRAV